MSDKTVTISEDQLADLNAGLTSLATAFAVLDTAVQSQLAVVVQQIAPQVAQMNPVLATAIANIGVLTNKMAQDAAALTAHIPAASTIDTHPPAPLVIPDAVPNVVVPTITKPEIAAPDAVAVAVDLAAVTTAAPPVDPANPGPAPAVNDPTATKPVMQQAPGSPVFE